MSVRFSLPLQYLSEHPLLLPHVGPRGSLYFSSIPSSPESVLVRAQAAIHSASDGWLDPRSIQLGCRAFNRLALDDRAAFFELVLRGRSLDELAREGGRLAVELARSARRALDVFALHGASAPMRTRGAASARDEGAVRPRDAAASRRLREEGTR